MPAVSGPWLRKRESLFREDLSGLSDATPMFTGMTRELGWGGLDLGAARGDLKSRVFVVAPPGRPGVSVFSAGTCVRRRLSRHTARLHAQ